MRPSACLLSRTSSSAITRSFNFGAIPVSARNGIFVLNGEMVDISRNQVLETATGAPLRWRLAQPAQTCMAALFWLLLPA